MAAPSQPAEKPAASDDERTAWLKLTLIPGIGNTVRRQLLKALGSPAAIFAASHTDRAAIVGNTIANTLVDYDSEKALAVASDWLAQEGNSLITLADADYPQALLNSPDPPLVMYCKGERQHLAHPALAMVGARNASAQGVRDAHAFAQALADAGFAIVSGLALGIDAAAHEGALAANGITIAVTGTGADRIYPARNADLAHKIAARGLLLSEFPLGTPPVAANFPRRNRIIAGLCSGCILVEAADRSGSLITARLAAEAGREVFALPGSIHSSMHKGCHRLIKQGAKLVESVQDILDELQGRPPGTIQAVPASQFADANDDPILAAMTHDPCDLDQLSARTMLSPDALLSALLALELCGRIATLPGGRYQRLN